MQFLVSNLLIKKLDKFKYETNINKIVYLIFLDYNLLTLRIYEIKLFSVVQ